MVIHHSYTYRPFLRTKAGEVTALKHLDKTARRRIEPIFQLTATVPSSFVPRMAGAWAGFPVILDGRYNFDSTGDTVVMEQLHRELNAQNIPAHPAIEVLTVGPYLLAVKKLSAASGGRLAIVAQLKNLPYVENWVIHHGWSMTSVDLIVHVGHVAEPSPLPLHEVVANAVSSLSGRGWKSVTLAASAAPKDMAALNAGRNVVPRRDWELWQSVYSRCEFQLDYADYAANHPNLDEPPGVAMAVATVSVRYTAGNDWIIFKGKRIGGANGQPMKQQYSSHAKALVGEAEFGGIQGCWADDRIRSIVAGSQTTGGRQQWVENAVNRHLTLVANHMP